MDVDERERSGHRVLTDIERAEKVFSREFPLLHRKRESGQTEESQNRQDKTW
jgi:hypothetical protein